MAVERCSVVGGVGGTEGDYRLGDAAGTGCGDTHQAGESGDGWEAVVEAVSLVLKTIFAPGFKVGVSE